MNHSGSRRAAAASFLFVFTAFFGDAAVAFAQTGGDVPCATSESEAAEPILLSASELASAHRPPDRLGSFQIVIVPSSGLSGNAAALAAFDRAAAQWEAYFSDPITITINADLLNLGSPSVIGSTGAVLLTSSYTGLRNAMVTDASDESDDGIMASMPTSASATFTMNSGFTYSGSLLATKANLKALGFTGLDTMFGASDGTINFNSTFAFDYDNSNGVGAGLVDFESVAAHEIGHLLGFTSRIDEIDGLVHAGTLSGTISPSTLDSIRFRFDANNPATAAEFTTFARNCEYNREDVTDEIAVQRRMSTGAWNGDGRQASHWKDDALTGSYIGAMDPNIGFAEVHDILVTDVRALDLVGYDALQCGNGVIDSGEQCDDSNVAAGDCCSATCQYEANGSACAPDAAFCTNDVCNNTGTCTHPAKTTGTACDDSLHCNGTDGCMAGSCLIHSGNPCTGGPVCNNVCDEAADNCIVTAGTACTDGLFCNGSDTCSGGTCSMHVGDPCTAGADCQDVCNETADNCAAPNATPCDDSLFCNGTDSCTGGACSTHAGDPCAAGADCSNVCTEPTDSCLASAGTACDDEGEVCTDDTCDGAGICEHTFDEMAAPECSNECPLAPQQGCLAPTKHTLQITDSTEAGKDKMSWKWQQGDEYALADLFGPGGILDARLCIYSGTGPSASLLLEVLVDASAAWTSNTKGAMYKDPTGVQNGVTSVKMKAGVDLKTSVQIKRKGTLTLPGPFDGTNFFDPAATILVQVANTAGTCWSAAFEADAMQLNEPAKAKTTDSTVICGDGSRDRAEQCDGDDDAGCSSGCDPACACLP